jgi:hypothetical protein
MLQKWEQAPKCGSNEGKKHSSISQKIKLFITTAVRTSNIMSREVFEIVTIQKLHLHL